MQEFMKIVLNRFKFILVFIGLLACAASAQTATDISLALSVEPSAMYPGETGTMKFEITNNGAMTTSILGHHRETMQSNGNLGYENINFDYNSLRGTCQFMPNFVPINHTLIFLVHSDFAANSTAICQIDFTIPEDVTAEFITFGYDFQSVRLSDPNPNNNMASVRINIKKRVRSVPVLNIWGGFALLLALMMAARQRYNKGIQCKN